MTIAVLANFSIDHISSLNKFTKIYIFYEEKDDYIIAKSAKIENVVIFHGLHTFIPFIKTLKEEVYFDGPWFARHDYFDWGECA